MSTMRKQFNLEGSQIGTYANNEILTSPDGLEYAMRCGSIIEARTTLCDSEQNLFVDLGDSFGIIPKNEVLYTADGCIKDIAILTRVGKPVCFKVVKAIDNGGNKSYFLSRRLAQQECIAKYISKLVPGDVINARITHLENFGAFVDIGCGVISMLPIDCMSVSRITHPRDRFEIGQQIKVVVKTRMDDYGRVTLSHKELLGTWEENAALFQQGITVPGIVRTIENYGVFVELTPNLAGLAEFREGVSVGNQVAVYIKSIIPEKMKIKLSVIDAFDNEFSPGGTKYYIEDGHIDKWKYSPDNCEKIIETVF